MQMAHANFDGDVPRGGLHLIYDVKTGKMGGERMLYVSRAVSNGPTNERVNN